MFLIFLIDLKLLLIVKESNSKKKLVLNIKNDNENNSKEIKDCESREKRIRNLVLMNTTLLIGIRVLDLISIFYTFNINNNYYLFCEEYYNCSKYFDYYEFIFSLNSFFQFILFYFFNTKFREAFSQIRLLI